MNRQELAYQAEGGRYAPLGKRWLLALFTYNRPELLKACVASIEAFFPWGDRLVVDDGSTDVKTGMILADLQHRGWIVERMSRTERLYGGFYRNMKLALEYALSHNYDYCLFFEDDEQFLWKPPDYPAYVERVFQAAPDAIQLQPLFMRRCFHYGTTTEYVESVGAYRTNRGFNTTAVWNLAAVRAHPDYRFIDEFGDGLSANSAYWLRKGYRLYIQRDPTVAVAPYRR